MFNKKSVRNITYLISLLMVSSDALASNDYHHFMQFVAVGLTSTAMLGASYLLLVIIGKSQVKKSKEITR